ncbi:MAG TPA: hypothetical protein VFZ73_16045, partial [Gemmatimonadaceae bacterium]
MKASGRPLAGHVAVALLPGLLLAGTPARVSQAPHLSLKQGLTLVYASSLSGEPDYEGIIVVEKVDTDDAMLRSSWNRGT